VPEGIPVSADRIPVHDMLAEARSHLDRMEPRRAYEAVRAGALLVDIRESTVRSRDGFVPGSIHHTLDVLEWRMDPDSSTHDPRVGGFDRQVILMCRQGFSSSLAARRLQLLGFEHATDVVGGFEAWEAAGLPITRPS
jgi:rhodanese-related sulfurtransferase